MKYTTTVSGSILFRRCALILAMAMIHGLAQAAPLYVMKDFESWPAGVLNNTSTPQIMINTSKDHQLFFKAYNDYSDLDRDGTIETTYTHAIKYYGYFDSTKCYNYNVAGKLFEPIGMADANSYCTGAMDPYWSGNFLNWSTMARIDTVRKILFGGHRRVDTATSTVLERTYLPHDAHSWAKYYDGADIEDLTPFTPGVEYFCDQGTLGLAGCKTGGVLDKRKIGITIGNTTDINMAIYKNKYSQVYEADPLMKVVRGNYSLWASNERWQILWASGAPIDNLNLAGRPGGGSNSNVAATSGIDAYSDSPAWTEGMGAKNHVVRIKACVSGLIGEERCKTYPGPDGVYATADDIAKPIGLLQNYGDDNQMLFGMVAGSYDKHAAGGGVIKNMGNFSTEVNTKTDGTFPLVSTFAGGPKATNQSEGLLNAWSLYRIIGYSGADGTYGTGDNCTWGLSDIKDTAANSRCQNWGNPFAEIYYQSISYLAGGGVIGDYRSNVSNVIPGLPVPQPYKDPLDASNYCASLSVINLNSSVISYDADQLDAVSYGPPKIWDPTELPGDKSSKAMTDVVGSGAGEKLDALPFYVGLTSLVPKIGNELCTEKTITSLGGVGGICPEAPRLLGSYRVAGLAHYAHTRDLRPDNINPRGLKGMQKVDTYSVALSSAVPMLEILHPITKERAATILPACRNTSLTPNANCAIVDFKVVSQVINNGAGTGTGKIYVNWEDSEQGGDYDQDMWGVLSYSINSNTNQLTITTDVIAQSTPNAMGFGYSLGGTTADGFHAHSGINSFKWTDAATDSSCSDANGCATADVASSKTYKLGTADAELLKDPLWYAAKWGGFLDKNGNNLPDQKSEWDAQINATGEAGEDDIPDTYFYASHPKELEDSLNRVLKAILERTSSGTAAAVVSSNVSGEGALYQAYYEPMRKDHMDNEAHWLGTVQALWLDKAGFTRQDCSPPRGYSGGVRPDPDKCDPPVGLCIPNGQLDNYCVDQVVETFFDETENRTRVRVFDSDSPTTYEPRSMQGVVDSFAAGVTTIVPNSMEGLISSYNSTTGEMTFTPYTMKGKVIAYDLDTGAVTVSVDAADINGPNKSFDIWRIQNASMPGVYGYSSDALAMTANPTLSLTINPAGDWIAVDDILTFETQGMVGMSGEGFNNWSAECVQGTTAVGEVDNFPLTLKNWDGATFVVTSADDFTPCTMIRISSFGLRGTACEIYTDWAVTNMSKGAEGTSTSSVALMNSLNEPGCVLSTPLTIDVAPNNVNWLAKGDRISLSNFRFDDQELYTISYLWNAREQLYLPGVTDAQLATNRGYGASAAGGRYIMTWIDSNLNNAVDNNEYIPFEKTMFSALPAVTPNFFGVTAKATAEEIVDYTRGIEVPNSRSRTLYYSNKDISANVMRLGDIVNSTPTVVGSPQEAFNILYKDASYTQFRRQYQDRRIVVYAGGNDGLIHAINSGFYNETVDANGEKVVQYVTSRKDSNGANLDVPHPLGSELWAYAPRNLLPHLQWLKDPFYNSSHVYFIDAKPRVFDANIFNPADTDHPDGWGTVMVVGMNTGGGAMQIDTLGDDGLPNKDKDNIIVRSAYVVFDITNPEVAPQMLGEIQVPDGSFTTVFPAIMAARDVGTTMNCNGGVAACNQWYLIFGTGPNDHVNAISTNPAKLYLFELSQLTTSKGTARPVAATTVPAGCTVTPITDNNVKFPGQSTTNMHLITCDTGVANSFVGTPVVVDWNNDFYADTSYFGLVGDTTGGSGRLMRFDLNNAVAPVDWDPLNTMLLTNQPVSTMPIPAIDKKHNKWIFIGTGRYFGPADRASIITQSLYGIKDDYSDTTVAKAELLNVTNTEVYADRTLTGGPALPCPSVPPLKPFDDLEKNIDSCPSVSGWFMDLPPILGSGAVPATRSVTNMALIGGILFSAVYQPSADPCEGEGQSRLYGLYYKTGTAYPGPTIFGTEATDVNGTVQYRSLKYLDVGTGTATSPAIHAGAGSGSTGVSVFTQLSTGDIVRSEAETVTPVRAGKIFWREH